MSKVYADVVEIPEGITTLLGDGAALNSFRLRDYDAIGMQTVLILLYVKQNPYGVKDVKAMQKLETKLNELIDNNDDPYYHISRKGSYSSYDSVNDIFFNIVQINLIIA